MLVQYSSDYEYADATRCYLHGPSSSSLLFTTALTLSCSLLLEALVSKTSRVATALSSLLTAGIQSLELATMEDFQFSSAIHLDSAHMWPKIPMQFQDAGLSC